MPVLVTGRFEESDYFFPETMRVGFHRNIDSCQYDTRTVRKINTSKISQAKQPPWLRMIKMKYFNKTSVIKCNRSLHFIESGYNYLPSH